MGKIIYTSRSRIVQRQECPRMGFLGQHYGGKGLQREENSLPLINGIALHAAHARLLAGESLESVVWDVLGDYRSELVKGRELTPELEALYREQTALLSGMIRTWNYWRLPKILEEFEIATHPDGTPFIEKEFLFEIAPGLVATMRLDAVLRRRDTKDLVIWDFKSLAYPSEDWYKQFEHNPQTYLYTAALADLMKEPVEGIAYEGLVKGLRRKDTAKSSPWYGQTIQSSPYTYGYRYGLGDVKLYQTEYTSKKGYEKCAVARDIGAWPWFQSVLVPENTASDGKLFNNLFCTMPPISPMAWEVERWRRQVTYAEYLNQRYLEEIDDAHLAGDEGLVTQLMDIYFPTNENRCFKYGVGNACQFTDLCFTTGWEDNLKEMGFIERIPHHELEKGAV